MILSVCLNPIHRNRPSRARIGVVAKVTARRLKPPDPARRASAKRGKRLSPELETGSPVAAVYDRRVTLWALFGGHRPPLQNPVSAQRHSTRSGGLRPLYPNASGNQSEGFRGCQG